VEAGVGHPHRHASSPHLAALSPSPDTAALHAMPTAEAHRVRHARMAM
jgi:hypothetical protein